MSDQSPADALTAHSQAIGEYDAPAVPALRLHPARQRWSANALQYAIDTLAEHGVRETNGMADLRNLRDLILNASRADAPAPGSEERCPTCGAGSDDIGIVIASRESRWGDCPPVTVEDRRSKCQQCGEEWYDVAQSTRHTIELLKATLTASRSESDRLKGEIAELRKELDAWKRAHR